MSSGLERILQYRDESKRLEQCQRLYNTSQLQRGFEDDAALISQGLAGLSTAIAAKQASLQSLHGRVHDLLRGTELAVRSFLTLRQRFPRLAGGFAPGAGAGGATPGMPGGGMLAPSSPQMQTQMHAQAHPHHHAAYAPELFYAGVPALPSPFLQHTVARFEHALGEFQHQIEEIERLLAPPPPRRCGGDDADGDAAMADMAGGGPAAAASVARSLPSIMANLHDFFMHVAALVEAVHQQVRSARAAYLADHRRRGDDWDPFLEADRREASKKEDAAARSPYHAAPPGPSAYSSALSPLLGQGLLPQPQPQPSPAGSLLGGSTGFGLGGQTPSAFGTPGTTGLGTGFRGLTTPGASTGLGFGTTPSSTLGGGLGLGGTTSSLFSFSNTGAAAGSTPSLFGAPAGTPSPATGGAAPSLFGAPASTPSLFGAAGSSPAAGSLFGSPAPSGGLLGAAPAAPSLFGTPSPSAFGTPSAPAANLFGGEFLSAGVARSGKRPV
eukprot:jgi/Mesen1/5579/ME000281S04640